MKYFPITLLCILFISSSLSASPKEIRGIIIDSATHIPICGATVIFSPANKGTVTDEAGRFFFHNVQSVNTIIITAVGYESKIIDTADFSPGLTIFLKPHQTQLADVVVSAHAGNPYKAISETDIKM